MEWNGNDKRKVEERKGMEWNGVQWNATASISVSDCAENGMEPEGTVEEKGMSFLAGWRRSTICGGLGM